jgi:hypothetical protein
MELSEIKSKLNAKDKFGKVSRRIKKNDVIADYYMQLYDETEDETLPRWADRIKSCCKLWDVDYYRFQGVKDIKRTNLCRSRFCDNCGNAQAIQRENKYAPFLDALARLYDIYHVVFTWPNSMPDEFLPSVDNAYKQFAYMIRLFTGHNKIRGISFEGYGFLGAVRALEITKNKYDGTFHPHFHCLFILKKGLRLDQRRKHVNSFSFSNPDIKKSHKRREYGAPERYFSDFEILLQKIWYLRFNGIKVTRDSISNLKEGYSVICDNAEGKYHEVFKYATKGIFKETEDGTPLNGYNDFVPLYYTLYRRKLIQGYGLLNKYKFEITLELDAKADEEYNRIIDVLRELESPERVFEYLTEIQSQLQTKEVTYISRASVAQLMADDYGE